MDDAAMGRIDPTARSSSSVHHPRHIQPRNARPARGRRKKYRRAPGRSVRQLTHKLGSKWLQIVAVHFLIQVTPTRKCLILQPPEG